MRFAVKPLAFLIALAVLLGCHGEHVTGIYTGLWHSDCHPEIYVAGKPVNGTPGCKWTPVNPPPDSVNVPW
jgi:hypothetical protein